MNEIYVACILIYNNNNNVLLCQRKGGRFDGLWEFPGGKVEHNETSYNAIIREIKEELELNIIDPSFLFDVYYQYDDFRLKMDVFSIKVSNISNITLNVHNEYVWTSINNIDDFKLIPADYKIVEIIKKSL